MYSLEKIEALSAEYFILFLFLMFNDHISENEKIQIFRDYGVWEKLRN